MRMTIQKEKIIFALYLSILSPKKDFVELLCTDVALRRLENTQVGKRETRQWHVSTVNANVRPSSLALLWAPVSLGFQPVIGFRFYFRSYAPKMGL